MPAIWLCSHLKNLHNYEYVKFAFVKGLKERSAADFETAPLSLWRFSRRLRVFSAAIPFKSYLYVAYIASRRKVCLSKSGAKVIHFSELTKENRKKVAKTCCKTYFCIKKPAFLPAFLINVPLCVIRFDRLCNNRASRIATLKVTTFRSYSARDVARF